MFYDVENKVPLFKRIVVTCILFLALSPFAHVNADISLSHLDNINKSSEGYVELKRWVDQALSGNAGYGFSATDTIYVYYITKEEKYLVHAIDMVDSFVADEEAKIASGSRPKIANDSYLHIGDLAETVSLAYSLGHALLSEEQRLRWSKYLDQAIYNVWNHSAAEWGGNSITWSGWATSNPDNNYYYSFLLATAMWALASNDQDLLDMLRNEKFPSLNVAMSALTGGGSVEGTGYGVSHRGLFRLYHYWYNSTGEQLDEGRSHTKDSIDYWIHATTPDFEYYAPFGDQARTSIPRLYYYHAQLVSAAIPLVENTEEAMRGRWWLDSISESPWQRMSRDFVYDTGGTSQMPENLTYFAEGLGQFFARESWNKNALWFAAVAGRADESHAHQEQGGFMLYQEGFLTVTGNVGSNGIKQATDRHNILRFEKSGNLISQNKEALPTITPSVSAKTSSLAMGLSNLYDNNNVQEWQRNLTFDGRSLHIKDVCETSSDVNSFWQLNVPVKPTISSNKIIAGDLVATISAPINPLITVESWQDLAGESANTLWRVSVSGEACGFDVLLESATSMSKSLPNPPNGLTSTVITSGN